MAVLVERSPLRAASLWLVPLAVLGLLLLHILSTPRLVARGSGTPFARAAIGHAIRREETGYRRKALEHFPGDTWSQGDDFSHQERDFVRSSAAAHDMRPGAVLDAIDQDVKAAPSPARGAVPPCMPRPFYQ